MAAAGETFAKHRILANAIRAGPIVCDRMGRLRLNPSVFHGFVVSLFDRDSRTIGNWSSIILDSRFHAVDLRLKRERIDEYSRNIRTGA